MKSKIVWCVLCSAAIGLMTASNVEAKWGRGERSTRHDIHKDTGDIQNDRKQEYQDVKKGDIAGAQTEQKDISQDRKDRRGDRRHLEHLKDRNATLKNDPNVQKDVATTAADRKQLNQDVKAGNGTAAQQDLTNLKAARTQRRTDASAAIKNQNNPANSSSTTANPPPPSNPTQ